MNKLPDCCKDCAEYGSKFCDDCIEELTEGLHEDDRVVFSNVLKRIARPNENMGSTDTKDSKD